MITWQKWALVPIVLAAMYLAIAGALSSWREPQFEREPFPMTAEAAASIGMVLDQDYEFDAVQFAVRDGIELFAREFEGAGDAAIILIHGITADSAQLNRSAGMLRDATSATVYGLDLRGHGASEGIAGDVDYIGQYEDDVLDIVAALRATDPERRIVVAGHSMGGGIATRAAMRGPGQIDGFVLFAPLMGRSAPTMRTEAPDGSDGGFMKVNVPRIIGIAMFDSVGIHYFDDRSVLFHNLPLTMRTRAYSFRAAGSMAPDDYEAGVRALDRPALVIVGTDDEAFVAAQYPPVFEGNGQAQVVVLPGVNHNAVTHAPAAIAAVAGWWAEHFVGAGLPAKQGSD